MAIRRAMLLPSRFIYEKGCDESDDSCGSKCPFYCMPPQPPLANPPPPPSDKQGSHHGSLLIIIFSILAAIFLLVTYYTIIKRYCNRRIAAARPTPALITAVHHEDHDENQDPTNYIWYVTTVGLDESVINSIAVYKYNKGDGLIEGTDCSVCLGEFHEDESLRLLPKCNHAFHLPCIDTWLRSHVNCPLCRANVVSSQPGPSLPAPVSSSSAEAEETQVENSRRIDGGGGSGRFMSARSYLRADEAESGADEGRGDTESAKGRGPSPHPNCVFRVQSDLVLNHRLGDSGLETTDDGAEPVRRSVSMDSSAAAMIRISLENLHPVYSEGSSSSMAVASSGMKRIVPKHRRNPSFFKLMGSCSKGSFLQKGPVAMKRSLSAGGKLLLSRHSRSRNSILPL